MILAIDQGTTGTTAILLNAHGKLVGKFTAAVPQHFPQPGWVEHDAGEIWQSVKTAVTQVLQRTSTPPRRIHSIGITNQRETVSLFDNTKPLHRFIVWQDRRTALQCERLKRFEKFIHKRSGLPLDPYFSATKIAWLKKKLRLTASNSRIRFRTIDSFLLNRLTGADVIEATNASRTSLMNLSSLKWDSELFDIFGIPRHYAPTICPSEGLELRTRDVGFLPNGIPVRAALGDQQAALFGQNGWAPGTGKITFGTGSFILLNTGRKPVFSKNNLVSTLAIQWSSLQKAYALEGSAFISGAWIQWLRDQLRIINTSAESEALASKTMNSGDVLVIPALSGLGAPFWNPHIRGAILGLTRGSNRHHIALASLEALCFQNKALIDSMIRDIPKLRTSWRVDGGAVRNDLLMKIQASVLGKPVIRPKNLEATGTGVALLAGYSAKLFSLSDIERLWKEDVSFKPATQAIQRQYQANYKKWLNAIDRLS